MLGNYQSAPSQMNALAILLRQTECYWLIRFLLYEYVNNGKLNVLGARYGLSYSFPFPPPVPQRAGKLG